MNFLNSYNPYKLILISLIGSLIIVYPNIAWLPWKLGYLEGHARTTHINFFIFRYIYFSVLIGLLVHFNLRKITTLHFGRRLFRNIIIGTIAYIIYLSVSYSFCSQADCFGSILIFQFIVMCFLCSFVGHVSFMYKDQRQKDLEIEQLKVENLQSRCDALANQINPHFFFNSLNSITALVRKKNDENTLEFVNKLSDVFRYILKSEKKGLVTLKEELLFISSFRYMLEVRFANKIEFQIKVDDTRMDLKIPSLSLLPLVDNIVVHNTIDSEHKMEVMIKTNDKGELEISNPIYPKIAPNITNGIGLKSLENRFHLLMNKKIKIKNDGKTFTVILPLK
ncbi:sensor histidine kinase [Plebeiibacterium sediminum]|uniref:Histidine kinase n=1 Tax=Plebeiibacterium sediminum TaxID=2992112 RepID=A0AAE3M120_9BACT|nr:histidine kinase [Plebeiobacterium sediminum]MCW3785279.1 histidine kinase [Plebeiobacterium sediminum]